MKTYARKGEAATNLRTGDFLLTHGDYWTSRLIRFGQGLRYPKDVAYYNHAALVVSNDGELVEALGRGVVRTHIDRYQPREYTLVRTHTSREDRKQVARFADSVEQARWRYGWLTLAGIAFSVATGSKFVIGEVGTAICSGFVAEALTRAGIVWAKPPSYMTPADLALHFGVRRGYGR